MAEKCNNFPPKQCFQSETTLKFQIFPKIIENSLFSSKKSVRFVTSLGTLFPVPVYNDTLRASGAVLRALCNFAAK